MSAPRIGETWRRIRDGVRVTVVGRRNRRGVSEVVWRAENNNRGGTPTALFERNYIPSVPASTTGSEQ